MKYLWSFQEHPLGTHHFPLSSVGADCFGPHLFSACFPISISPTSNQPVVCLSYLFSSQLPFYKPGVRPWPRHRNWRAKGEVGWLREDSGSPKLIMSRMWS